MPFWRRRIALPDGWEAMATDRIAAWPSFDDEEQARLADIAAVIASRKRWEAANRFALTDEMKVVISLQAARLVLELGVDWYDDMGSIVVHPTTMVRTGARPTAARGVLTEEPLEILGETGYRGPVLIAWDSARDAARHPEHGHDVVLHEFAHQLDLRDGIVDGTPPMDDPAERQRWIEVCTPALERVRHDADHLQRGVLDPYAGTNPGEFFAVSTEVFFTRPRDLRDAQPALYEVLADFYLQDPAARGEARPVP